MARASIRYDSSGQPFSQFVGHDPDLPATGYYRMRLRSGGVYVGVRIWRGLPLDPTTGEEMDRAAIWNAQINGAWSSIDRVWPRCAGEPIDAAEYHHLSGLQAWGREHAPDSPFANPSRRINPLTAPTPF